MPRKVLSQNSDITFATWTGSDGQFEKYPYNIYRIELTDVICSSPELFKDIIEVRSSLNEVELLDGDDVFGD